VSDVVGCCALLSELGSSKFGAGVFSGGRAEEEEDNRAALATAVLLPVLMIVDAKKAMVLALRSKKSRLLPVEGLLLRLQDDDDVFTLTSSSLGEFCKDMRSRRRLMNGGAT
jgi:hypothetical protein